MPAGIINTLGDIGVTPDGQRLLLSTGPEHTAQSLRIGATISLGTWVYNLNAGFPLREILEQDDLEIVRILAYDWLEAQPQVSAVTSVSVERNRATRAIEITFSVTTPEGTIDDVYAIGATI